MSANMLGTKAAYNIAETQWDSLKVEHFEGCGQKSVRKLSGASYPMGGASEVVTIYNLAFALD